MFLSICAKIVFTFLLIIFDQSTIIYGNTIGKACGTGSSSCGLNQACVSGKCECDPKNNFFWTGPTLGCRICPAGYHRDPDRCVKYHATAENRSQARANCRREQADLFTWRDNNDENYLLFASTQQWGFNYQSVRHQFYTWSGGIVNHNQGNKNDYQITWVDPQGPTMGLPLHDKKYETRYCSTTQYVHYSGDPEPTRTTKNGEREDCVTFVFLPVRNGRGTVCMADDFCSTRIGYICEMTALTISGGTSQTSSPTPSPPRPVVLIGDGASHQPVVEDLNMNPSAQSADEQSTGISSKIYVIIGLIVVLIIAGVAAVFFLRKRKRTQTGVDVSPAASMASSMMSTGDA